MGEYYLIAQLPSLDGVNANEPIPITEQRFLELCSQFLAKKVWQDLQKVTLVPSVEPEKSKSSLLQAWWAGERNLRLALGKVRAEKRSKVFDLQDISLPEELYRVATAAVGIGNPLEAEIFLLNHRLSFLETLRPMDPFSEEFVFYYALKLKMLLRIKQFDTKTGEATYQNIYSSILHGDRLEA